MKATGIVRRIDDLGRVVIPKEIRRTMRTARADPLEIYTDKDGGVIFKKYSLMGGLSDFAGQMCETLNKTTGEIAVITDRDACIAVAGLARRELTDKRISSELEQIMEAARFISTRQATKAVPCKRRREQVSCGLRRPHSVRGRRTGLCALCGHGGRIGQQ